MKKIRKFKCVNGYTFDRMVPDDVLIVKCECGEFASRLLSAARFFGNGAEGKSPSAR